MSSDFHFSFSPFIHAILDDLHRWVGPLYLVGGTVRNMLLNNSFSNELNVLVPWSLSECQKKLEEGGHHSVTMGNKHNSLLLSLKGGENGDRSVTVEIATFRHRPDCLPTVEEDLLHRDLTVNAMAFTWPNGPLIDPLCGWDDLKQGRIRFVQGTAAVEEDPLRALRFFRFVFQLRGKPDEVDLHAAENAQAESIPQKKLRAEIDRIFSLPLNDSTTRPWVRRFFRSPLVQGILDDILTIQLCEIRESLAKRWKRAISMILGMSLPDKQEEVPLLDLRWAALLHEMGELSCIALEKGSIRSSHRNSADQKIREILREFRFAQKRQRRILDLLRHFDVGLVPSDRILLRLIKDETPVEGLFRLIHVREVSNIRKYCRKSELPKPREPLVSKALLDQQLNKVLERCRLIQQANKQPSPQDLAMSGGEILDWVRRPQGPWVGEVIEMLLEWVDQDPSRNQRPLLQEKIQEWIASQRAI